MNKMHFNTSEDPEHIYEGSFAADLPPFEPCGILELVRRLTQQEQKEVQEVVNVLQRNVTDHRNSDARTCTWTIPEHIFNIASRLCNESEKPCDCYEDEELNKDYDTNSVSHSEDMGYKEDFAVVDLDTTSFGYNDLDCA